MFKKAKQEKAAVPKKEVTTADMFVNNDPEFAAAHGYDPYLISQTQPLGNLHFGDTDIESGSGYAVPIQIVAFPDRVFLFWLDEINRWDDVITEMQVSTEDIDITKDKLNRSLEELESRKAHNPEEEKVIVNSIEKLDNMLSSIVKYGETVNLVSIRLFVYNKDKTKLRERVQSIISTLASGDYQAAMCFFETEQQYRSLFLPYSRTVKEQPRRAGACIPSCAMGHSYPFNNESLNDDCGMYLGHSSTGGSIFLNLFLKTRLRLSYDAMVLGNKGSGKSTLLKKLVKWFSITGNFIRVLDCTGDFTELAKKLGGIVVMLNGEKVKGDTVSGVYNIMEIAKASETESMNFSHQMSKLSVFFKFVSPNCTDAECGEFSDLCRKLYIRCGLYDPNKPADEQEFTGLDPKTYPTLKDLLQLIDENLFLDVDKQKVNKDISDTHRERLENVRLAISDLVESNPQMFTMTTTIPSLVNQHLVVYNVEGLADMKPELFNAVLFNVLNLMLADMINIGKPSKDLYEQGVPIEEVPKLILIVDEAHKFINTQNPQVIDFMGKILREGRKYFTSLILASQSIRDYVPESKESEKQDKLKSLFELAQYKFIMQQDSNAVPMLRQIFEGRLTETQLKQIPNFGVGQTVLLTGKDSINMTIEVSDSDVKLFKGGA